MPAASARPRARDLGIVIGSLEPGTHNSITDVPGVKVGHVSLIAGDGPLVEGHGPVRTGVTAVLPHPGDIFREQVEAAAHVINGFGKSVGLPQLVELGVIETPILLTGTLNVWAVADAVADHTTHRNPGVYSVNPVVGECNDSRLNDALGRHVQKQHVLEAIETAGEANVEEGNVGAGAGMSGFGWKAGIGTSSRRVALDRSDYIVGVLVLTNTGEPEELRIDGVPVGRELAMGSSEPDDGSIIILIATDAPLDSRQLGRIARRAAFGLARTGATASHGSGDFAIAFSTATRATPSELIPEPRLSAFFTATIDAVEEAIINSLLRAETMVGRDGAVREAIPIDRLRSIMARHGRLSPQPER